MTSTIYEIIQKEKSDKGLVKIPYLQERMAASVGAHVVNKWNLEMNEFKPEAAFMDGGELENLRLHMVMMAPSGFGKSLSFRLLLNPRRGLLSKTKLFETTLRTTFTTESWIGTAIKGANDTIKVKEGLFERYKTGIVGADEFMRFVGMMDTRFSDEYSNEEVYLLQALDSDHISKDMSYHSVEIYGIGTTMWCGSRVTCLDMKHGLARRVLFPIFIPTPKICADFRKSMRSSKRKRRISDDARRDMARSINSLYADLQDIDEIDYGLFFEYLDSFPNIPHFEEGLLKRIALGYSAARGTLPDIVMDADIQKLIQDEIRNRLCIRNDPEVEIVRRAVEEQGEMKGADLKSFLSVYYQYTHEKIENLIRKAVLRRYVSKSRRGGGYLYTVRNNDHGDSSGGLRPRLTA